MRRASLRWLQPATRRQKPVKKWPVKWPVTQIPKNKTAIALTQPPIPQQLKMVGATRFELVTFCTPTGRSTVNHHNLNVIL